MNELHQIAAAVYLMAALAAVLGLALPVPKLGRIASALLALGATIHGVAFVRLHTLEPTPALTGLPAVVSLAGWMGALFCLAFSLRGRVLGLVAPVASLAFVAVVFAGERLALSGAVPVGSSASWAHLHVLLASAGLALLGVAALAGVLFLVAERRLKSRRPLGRARLPSLEVLDRVNVVALALGFPLLTLAMVAGMLWSRALVGRLWPGGTHVNWMLASWILYAALAGARFGAGWRGREAAVSAAIGFGFLLAAVVVVS